MESNWAAEHLQTIRTLMERSALYRRALAPIMIVAGSIGLIGGIVSSLVRIEGNRRFSLFWMGVSLIALIAALLLVRRQALKAAESFWSLPTRRITLALLPEFLAGLVSGLVFVLVGEEMAPVAWLLALLWTLFYGFALHAAGFFMQRGIKFFGWLFVVGGVAFLAASAVSVPLQTTQAAHYTMGFFFGLLHLAYGIYLYFTEKSRNVA